MIGRFLCGISAGCYSFVLPIYVGEISTNEIRGTLLSLFQVALNLGVLFVFTIGHFSTLIILNIVCMSIPIIYSLAFLILPESPPFLISQHREAEAENSLKKLRGKFYKTGDEIDALKAKQEESELQKKSFVEVFKTKSTMKAFIIIMLQFLFFQMSGINGVLLYATTIFVEAGINLEPGIASIIVSFVQVLATFISIVFVDRFGRKILLCLSNGFMCLSLIGIASYFTLKDAGESVESLSWLPLLSLCIFVIAFSAGMGPVSYILLGELFLQDAKAFVAPIGQTLNFFLTFVIAFTFPMLTSSIGSGGTFFMFSGFCFLALLFTIFIIPETKGKSMSEIQHMLS